MENTILICAQIFLFLNAFGRIHRGLVKNKQRLVNVGCAEAFAVLVSAIIIW